MINFNELSGAVPEREKIKQLLIQESVSGSSFQEIILVLSDELEQEYQKGWNYGYDEARDEYQ